MHRRRRSSDLGDSLDEYQPSDTDSASDPWGSDTDLTDAEDYGDDSVSEDDGCDKDVEDEAELFAGNKFSAEYYIKALEEFDESVFAGQHYCEGTTLLLDRIEEQWNQFCTFVRRDPARCFEAISIRLLYFFFHWLLNRSHGKDGRRLRGTTKRSSLGTYWKLFRLVYERATGQKLDGEMNRRMHRVVRHLADKHDLGGEKREKRCMTIEDLKRQIQTTLSTTEKRFDLGELRVLCVLFLLLMAPTGARPTSLLLLRFGDILISLARDPDGGPHRILIRFTLKFTKGYLGSKEANTFPLPEVLFDPSLVVSPHVFLLGILFANRAFKASSLTSPEELGKLDIRPGNQELALPLKENLREMPVFRRATKTLVGFEMSQTERLPYSTMAPWIRRMGELTGFKVPTIPYNLRYNAGNEFDKSGDVSDALRNLMMQHADSRTFLKHYIPRDITADTMAIVRGDRPQHTVMRAACSMSRSIDVRRPTKLTAEQSLSVNNDPRIKRLVQDREKARRLSRQSAKARREYEKLVRKVASERKRLRLALKNDIRDTWDVDQAVNDIEGQLSGAGFADDAKTEEPSVEQLPTQRCLMEALWAPVAGTIEEDYRRRDAAINAVIALCRVEEHWVSRLRPHPQRAVTRSPPPVKMEVSQEDIALEAARVSVFNERRPTVCLLCLGNKRLPVAKRVYSFSTPGDLTKHFRRKHLSNLKEDEPIKCELCRVSLDHKMHLQSHALRVHGTIT